MATPYFIDHDAKEGQLSGTLTFTNGSDQVTGSGTQFTTELQVGDYIISDDPTYGKEWYKVVEIIDDVTLRIDHAFYQETHSSTASYNKQSNVTDGGTSASYDSGTGVGPFCHIQQFFDVAQAGDVGYVRRGKTYTVTKVMSPVNDGSASSFIILMADDGTGWPDETGLDKPVISMDGKTIGDYIGQIDLCGDDYWKIDGFVFDDVDLQGIAYYNGCIYGVGNAVIENCEYGANVSYAYYKFIRVFNGKVEIINCTGSNGIGVLLHYDKYAKVELKNCHINSLTSQYTWNPVEWNVKNCSFSSTTPEIRGKAKILSSGMLDNSAAPDRVSDILIEDGDSHASIYYTGRVEKDMTNYTGSATSSVKVAPSSNCNLYEGLTAFEWKITNISAAEHTVKVYVKGSGWTTFPTADELYIEVEYLDEATGTHTATAKSSEVLDANDTWKAFTVTFTPAQDGDIYVRGYLKKYEDGAVVWFNGEVEIT